MVHNPLPHDAPEKHQLLVSSAPVKPGTDDVHVHSVSTTSLTSQSYIRRDTEGAFVPCLLVRTN